MHESNNFKKCLTTSLGVHAFAAFLIALSGLLFHHTPVKLLPSIRVDLVGLPDLTKREEQLAPVAQHFQKKAQIQEAKSMKAPLSKTIKLKKIKPNKKSKSSSDLLKNAIERIRAVEKIEESMKKMKGNAISASSNTGLLVGNTTPTEYASQMQSKLKSNWNLPVWLAKQKLAATAEVFLDHNGAVRNAIISKSSSNLQFDDYVLKTIERSQPFGPPPKEWIGVGIELGFPL